MEHEPQERTVRADGNGEGDPPDPIQEADEESFPASDAPSSWTGGDARPAGE